MCFFLTVYFDDLGWNVFVFVSCYVNNPGTVVSTTLYSHQFTCTACFGTRREEKVKGLRFTSSPLTFQIFFSESVFDQQLSTTSASLSLSKTSTVFFTRGLVCESLEYGDKSRKMVSQFAGSSPKSNCSISALLRIVTDFQCSRPLHCKHSIISD